MLKPFLSALTLTLPLLTTVPVLAIAPGTEQARYCGDYTTDYFRVTARDVKITNVRRQGSNYRISWEIPEYRGRGYCLLSKYNKLLEFRIEREPQFAQGNLGPNEKRFNNLPGYGDVIVNRGQAAIGDKQYFLVKPIRTGRTYKWYARCGYNADQVYNERGKYVGYDRRLTVMFPYVCEVSSLSRPPRPQPR